MPEAKTERAPMDYSVVEGQIAALKKEVADSKAQGFFKRAMDSWNRGVKADTVELLEKGLRLVKGDPEKQAELLKAYDEGKKTWNEQAALDYVEEIGKGNFYRKIRNGEVVDNSGRHSKDSILNQ